MNDSFVHVSSVRETISAHEEYRTSSQIIGANVVNNLHLSVHEMHVHWAIFFKTRPLSIESDRQIHQLQTLWVNLREVSNCTKIKDSFKEIADFFFSCEQSIHSVSTVWLSRDCNEQKLNECRSYIGWDLDTLKLILTVKCNMDFTCTD